MQFSHSTPFPRNSGPHCSVSHLSEATTVIHPVMMTVTLDHSLSPNPQVSYITRSCAYLLHISLILLLISTFTPHPRPSCQYFYLESTYYKRLLMCQHILTALQKFFSLWSKCSFETNQPTNKTTHNVSYVPTI